VILRENDNIVNALEAEMLEQLPVVDCPLTHRFCDGLYIREIFMPAGSLVTSKIHKTEHPFIISKGIVSVSIDGGEWQMYEAPYTGITKPGTRRVLFIHEDCVWTTIHKNDDNNEDVAAIERRIIEPYINELINNKNIEL
jgi:hypothetical protein